LLELITQGSEPDEPFLLGRADRLIFPPLGEKPLANAPVLFSAPQASGGPKQPVDQWTGWAVLLAAHVEGFLGKAAPGNLEASLRGLSEGTQPARTVKVSRPLRMDTFEDILAAHRAVLDKEFPTRPQGRETEPGVWIGRKTRLHSTVQLIPPVAVGDNCLVGAGVRLGPYATLVGNCLLDDHAAVSNSVVFPGSYIGPGLDLEGVIVDQKYLTHVRNGRTLLVADDFVLGSLATEPAWEPSPA